MELKIGETKSFKLPFILKAVDIACEGNGLRLERKGESAVLNVNNCSRRTVYAAIPLGRIKDLNQVGFTVKAQSKTRMLFSVGAVRFVIDYASRKVATNLIGLQVAGSKEWGETVQMPWRAEYLPLFGLPLPPMEMDRNTAEYFWMWFREAESTITTLVGKSRKDAKRVCHQIELWLYPVFPYVKNGKMDFDLESKDYDQTFIFRCGGDEQLAADAAAFGRMMPEGLQKTWKFVVEE